MLGHPEDAAASETCHVPHVRINGKRKCEYVRGVVTPLVSPPSVALAQTVEVDDSAARFARALRRKHSAPRTPPERQ